MSWPLEAQASGVIALKAGGPENHGSGTGQDFQSGYMTWDPVNGVRVF